MTSTHHIRPVPATDAESAAAVLRERGLRLSAARRLVLEALFSADGPVSAERIAGGLDGRLPRLDVASVYRNLETLEAVGLVRHVHLGHGPGLYAPILAGEREYLVCELCDRVWSFDPRELGDVRNLISAAFGFEASFSHFPIVGVCRHCAAARDRDTDDEHEEGIRDGIAAGE